MSSPANTVSLPSQYPEKTTALLHQLNPVQCEIVGTLGIQEAVLQDIREFVGDAPQFDDITLVVIMRERNNG